MNKYTLLSRLCHGDQRPGIQRIAARRSDASGHRAGQEIRRLELLRRDRIPGHQPECRPTP